jgi:hypothetical protein
LKGLQKYARALGQRAISRAVGFEMNGATRTFSVPTEYTDDIDVMGGKRPNPVGHGTAQTCAATGAFGLRHGRPDRFASGSGSNRTETRNLRTRHREDPDPSVQQRADDRFVGGWEAGRPGVANILVDDAFDNGNGPAAAAVGWLTHHPLGDSRF